MDKIKGDVQRMVKRRKDSGFTLIELMIVIAVIGILAVVLVPKFGGIKDAAKLAGIETNVHVVEVYVQSHIDKWSTDTDYDTQAEIADKISKAIGGDIKDPFNNTYGFSTTAPTTPVAGKVQVNVSGGSGAGYTVTISGFDKQGDVYKSVIVTH